VNAGRHRRRWSSVLKLFDPESVAGSPIRKYAGCGDAVTPAVQSTAYPALLPEVPAPPLHAYPKATVVAEKLHAVTVLGMTNARMKDFFDLWGCCTTARLTMRNSGCSSSGFTGALSAQCLCQ
jgi:hypothetical protein